MAVVASASSTALMDAIEELAEYLKEPPLATAFNVGNSFFCAAEEWRRRDPKTPEEILAYYRESEALVRQLVFANYGIPHELARIRKAHSVFDGASNVVDLGAGIGSFLLEVGADVRVHADVGGPALDYARWRYLRAHIDVREVTLGSGYLQGAPFGEERFDGVICTEVIEHAPDPVDLLRFVSELLVPGGKLLATVSFDDPDGMMPQHLNVAKWDNEDFIGLFSRFGLDRLDDDVFVKR